MREHSGRILVIRGGAIGDFIVTLPVFAALRAQFPRAQLGVLGYREVARLALVSGLVDSERSIEAQALAGFFAEHGELAPTLREYFAGFDVILSYLYDPDGVFQRNVARCSSAQFIAGPHRPDEQGELHATEVLLKPLERLAIFDADPQPKLIMSSAGSDVAPDALAMHPGSGSEKKNWPEPRWAEALSILGTLPMGHPLHRPLLLVGGEAEGARLERLAQVLPSGRMRLASRLPLTELALQLQHCTAFIGHDSGITHLAAALSLPVLCLWGETNERVWRPRSERARLLHTPAGLAALSVESVLEALAALLSGEGTSTSP